MGSGTTLFVAEKMKRNSIGIDIMPQYYEMVLKKIESTNYYLFDKRGSMFPINLNEISKYVEDNISTFHSKRLSNLENLSLDMVLIRKNPYLFKAKNVLTASDMLKEFLMLIFLPKKKRYLENSWKAWQFLLIK